CVGALDDRDGYSARLVGGPLRLVALIAAIDKGHCHPWALTMNRAEHGREYVSILDTCGCDLALDWQAECIHRDMSLAALDFLARVEAARPARFRRLDRLAVDDDRRRRGLAALILARGHHEHPDDLGPQSARGKLKIRVKSGHKAVSKGRACARITTAENGGEAGGLKRSNPPHAPPASARSERKRNLPPVGKS